MIDGPTRDHSRLIDDLDLPAALHGLTPRDLCQVAAEVRKEIIETVSCNGGHLGASLGVVELTIALHAELRAPEDVIVWDVGHQSYAHKLLTGRLEGFRTLRRHGGLSGFPSRAESRFDAYGTGHASNSISAALGMLEGRRQSGAPARVVAVIGDGALTGGMAYEALNHAGHLHAPILVILNDNAMSIERNVGAMSVYLSRLRTDPRLYRLRRDIERRVQQLPGVGERMAVVGEQLKDSIKAAIVPGMLFEELGFTYVGVIDGHDIDELRASIRRSLTVDGPVLLHCRTVKGKGYEPAERHPGRYHGPPRFSVSTGEYLDPESPTSFTKAFGKALVTLAERDQRVVGITAAMAAGTGLSPLKDAFPERFFDVGIAEQHAVGFAAGLAAAGRRPVVAIYSTFLQRAFDQIIHDVCLQSLPVVFAVDRAGLVGEDGPTHHGAFDISFLRIIPGLQVFVPKDEADLQRLLASCLRLEGPSVIRYPRSAGLGVSLPAELIPREGPWVQVERPGEDLLILTVGPLTYAALEATKHLSAQGVEATVASVGRIHPLEPEALIELIEKHQAVLTVEDNSLAGGFGSAILELMSDRGLLRPASRIGLPDKFIEHGPSSHLHSRLGLTPEGVALAARRLVERVRIRG